MVGIPQSLIYYKFSFPWEIFFEKLKIPFLLSPKSNKEIIEKGVKIADPESCFAIKVFFGHLSYLEKKCDFLFVPRLKKTKEGLEYCPRFFGLPDLAKVFFKKKILTFEINFQKNSPFKYAKFVGKFFKKSEKEIKEAYEACEKIVQKEREKKKKNFFEKVEKKDPKILLISHPYNLYDEFLNFNLKKRIEKIGFVPIFIDEVPLGSKSSSRFHWEFAKEMILGFEEILKITSICGVIQISSFLCGCDAVMKEIIKEMAKKHSLPLLELYLDEESSPVGYQTRIEAFLESIL